MKLSITFYASDESYSFAPAEVADIASGSFYEVPKDVAEKWMTAQTVWDEVQLEADRWVLAHPNTAQEPDIEIAKTEPIYTWDYEG